MNADMAFRQHSNAADTAGAHLAERKGLEQTTLDLRDVPEGAF